MTAAGSSVQFARHRTARVAEAGSCGRFPELLFKFAPVPGGGQSMRCRRSSRRGGGNRGGARAVGGVERLDRDLRGGDLDGGAEGCDRAEEGELTPVRVQ